MRKRIAAPVTTAEQEQGWLKLTDIATVEVASEEASFPIEAVFTGDGAHGWRASAPGPQLIRILFDEPVSVSRIRLRFEEQALQRTQEFTLSWCPAAGGCKEIVRQQFNFSPAGATTELEEYSVNLDDVAARRHRHFGVVARRRTAIARTAIALVFGGGAGISSWVWNDGNS